MDFALRSPSVISHVTSMIRTAEMNHKDLRFFISLLSEAPLYIWYYKNFVTLDAGKQTSHSRSFFSSSYFTCFYKSRFTVIVYAIKACGSVDAYFHWFLISALNRSELPPSYPDPFTSLGRPLVLIE